MFPVNLRMIAQENRSRLTVSEILCQKARVCLWVGWLDLCIKKHEQVYLMRWTVVCTPAICIFFLKYILWFLHPKFFKTVLLSKSWKRIIFIFFLYTLPTAGGDIDHYFLFQTGSHSEILPSEDALLQSAHSAVWQHQHVCAHSAFPLGGKASRHLK